MLYIQENIDLLKELHENPTKTEILEEISKEFGNDVISEGKLNRKILREKVFIDKNKVKLLNEITHPAIIEEIKLEINKNAEESLVVLDIPLLFEGNYEFLVDKSLLIFCDENIQIERIKERDKVDTQNAINIIKNQLSLLEKNYKSDIFKNKIKTLLKELREKFLIEKEEVLLKLERLKEELYQEIEDDFDEVIKYVNIVNLAKGKIILDEEAIVKIIARLNLCEFYKSIVNRKRTPPFREVVNFSNFHN